jgi:hypothetical protein
VGNISFISHAVIASHSPFLQSHDGVRNHIFFRSSAQRETTTEKSYGCDEVSTYERLE